jgi:hypothetical protein
VWHSVFDTVFERQIVAGLSAEVIERLQKRGALEERSRSHSLGCIFNPFELACELDDLVRDAGISPFLHTRFVAPVLEGRRLSAAVLEDATGRRALRAKFFVDATGDATVVHRAGFATWRQPHLQPPTTCPLIRGVDAVRKAHPDFAMSWVFDPRFPEALRPGFIWDAPLIGQSDVRMVAGTRIHGADCSDAETLTRAEMEGRRQARSIRDILRRLAPAPEDVALVGLPARIGIRQTRQAACLHRLTETEVLDGVRFPDAVANGSYRVDVHFADRGGLVFRYLDGREVTVIPGEESRETRWRPPRDRDPTFYQIPYRCLVPEGAENLLVAGRGLDADEGAYGAIRVMINTNQTGQSAGTAAWLALDSGTTAPNVPVDRLRSTLARSGAVVI